MDAITSPNLHSSPTPLSSSDFSPLEEGKQSPSQASTSTILASPSNAHKVIAELVGTYIIVFTGCGAMMVNRKYELISSVGIAVAWGMVVMVMIYAFGHISGANFNPALTIAFAIFCKFPWKQVPAYVAAQVVGSTLAMKTLSVLFPGDGLLIHAAVTEFVPPVTYIQALAWEFILSFTLMLAICGVATDTRGINELSGVTVGATVLFNFLLAGNITGASMNPARSIGPAVVSRKFKCLWVYIVAPILGASTAAFFYGLLWLPVPQKDNNALRNSVGQIPSRR